MGMLRLDWNIVATIVNLLVLYFLMRRFLFGPIQAILDKRKELIESRFHEAKEEQLQAGQMKEKYQGLLANAKEESAQIVERAREQAKTEYESRLSCAEEQAEKMLEAAREKMEQEHDKMLKELESQISTLVMCAAGKVIGRNASPKYDEALYNQFLDEAGGIDGPDRN
ncbi:F0F1 ATP synthase subunit B [[Clostridium] polysaccharolyticum]|uniref:ATP synthase subunit b n=1 Tax=[Clostridium] polysaccharolyticum TaxID=29364 RepID=A0A1H9ZXE6_9FIRM|nr:F0F1 ATP synthase subunit B [[Clostridium] polysaccharolyticum]SES86454.1 F-type H+-transporting ATPase subunit b [[Clostridium] polysaccharolyticum]